MLLSLALLGATACGREEDRETTAEAMTKAESTTAAETTTATVESTTAVGEVTTAEETTSEIVATTTEEVAPKAETTTAVEITTIAEVTTQVPETEAPTAEYISAYHGEYGSAGTLTGTTVVVSIVTNDRYTHWGFTNGGDALAEDDLETLRRQKDYLLQACEWLTEQAAGYDKSADFIADWERYPGLYYEYDTADELVRYDGSMYTTQKDFILENIPSDALKKKYRADNIVYIFYFNTPLENEVNPWSLGNVASPICDIEFINAFVRFDGFYSMPTTYAHEMLHCFGAYDLYYASYGIPQEYVDYLRELGCLDIMYCTFDSEDILVTMGQLDAYYVGLTDVCEDVELWNLVRAQTMQ